MSHLLSLWLARTLSVRGLVADVVFTGRGLDRGKDCCRRRFRNGSEGSGALRDCWHRRDDTASMLLGGCGGFLGWDFTMAVAATINCGYEDSEWWAHTLITCANRRPCVYQADIAGIQEPRATCYGLSWIMKCQKSLSEGMFLAPPPCLHIHRPARPCLRCSSRRWQTIYQCWCSQSGHSGQLDEV